MNLVVAQLSKTPVLDCTDDSIEAAVEDISHISETDDGGDEDISHVSDSGGEDDDDTARVLNMNSGSSEEEDGDAPNFDVASPESAHEDGDDSSDEQRRCIIRCRGESGIRSPYRRIRDARGCWRRL